MESRPPSLFRSVLARCLLSLASIVIALLLFEVYVRTFRSHKDLLVLTGRVVGPSPMSEWATLDAFAAYRPKPGLYAQGKTVNAHGFISTPEIDRNKPEGSVRIVFLGESSTAGTGENLRDEDTWPWQAVGMLRGRVNVPVDFINGAVGGYTSFESYGRLWSRLRHFAPDIVVVMHGWNEMFYFDMADRILDWRTIPDGSWTLERASGLVVTYPPLGIDPIMAWSQGLTRIRLGLSRSLGGEVGAPKSGPLKRDFNHKGLSIWRGNLRLLRETSDLLGAKLFIVKQATLSVASLPPEEHARCRYHYHGFDHDAHVRAFQGIYDVIDEEIASDSIIDLTSLSGRSDLFYDAIHPTPPCCRQIAAIVSEALAAHIGSRSAPEASAGS